MQIRRTILPLVAVLVLGLAPLGFGQLAAPRTPHRTLGYYDPATGAFEPLRPAEEVDATAVTPTTGDLVLKFTLTVKATIPKNGVIGCTAEATVSDSSGFSADEHASGVATLVSGTTYSCTATIHYSWLLSSPTADKIYITSTSTLEYGYEVTATNGTGTVVEAVSARGSTQPVAAISVPANGATTTESVSMTL